MHFQIRLSVASFLTRYDAACTVMYMYLVAGSDHIMVGSISWSAYSHLLVYFDLHVHLHVHVDSESYGNPNAVVPLFYNPLF